MAAHADRIMKVHQWGYGLDRLVDKFPFFQPLRAYAERIREMRLLTSRVHDAALRIAKSWRSLGVGGASLIALIDDITNMRYRNASEVSRNIQRHPTKDEFQRLVQTHKVSREALQVFNRMKLFFETMAHELAATAVESAQRNIKDPQMLTDQVDKIIKGRDQLLKKPYFPFVRFGRHFVVVRDAKGNVVHFETFERRGLRSAEAAQQMGRKELEQRYTKANGYSVKDGILSETAAPFVGLPPALLDTISRELGLTDIQKLALDQLKYEYSPQASFVQHLRQKNYTPGYSKDFLRAFSRYGFHVGRYYGRIKYSWALRDQIAEAGKYEGNTAGAIRNYMEDHLQNTVLSAKGDFSFFKGAIFLWVFGYSPAGATINLSQIPLITYPWLSAKFGGFGKGDALATAAIVKAATDVRNFYTKGAYDKATDFEMRALDYGIRTGRITEAMASQLAGMAQGENLLSFGNSKLVRGFSQFMEKAPLLFELSEQFNRRVTYRAALDLAQKYPKSIAVREAMNKYADEYQQLLAEFTPTEAQAVVTASHATEQTQFVYARETRPRVIRGRFAGTLFVFKTYMLNVLQLLLQNKSTVLPRYALMMMALGGIMGLPGSQDLADLSESLGKWMFGKDFSVELALRQLIKDVVHEKIPPDIVLHGMARRGFGLPALVDMMGEAPGRGLSGKPGQNVPFPQVDMSQSIGMGRLIPFELGRFLNPEGDPGGAIAATAQQASGAVFGVGFNLYKALQAYGASPKNDIKIWEKVMPRALASASRAYRAFNEGRERSSRGGPQSADTIVPYNVRDPEQMAEILALAMGYTPLRQSAKWDTIIAESEVKAKYAFDRELLMKQMFEALAGKNQEEIDRVRSAIRNYNINLPKWARGFSITGSSVRESMISRFKGRAIREHGYDVNKKLTPLDQHIQSLFPESVVDVRRIR